MMLVFFLLVLLVALTMFLHRQKVRRIETEKKLMQQDFEQQLLQSQMEVQEATFSALGKELHDNVGQLLSSTKMLLGITQRNLSNVPDTLTTAEETLGKAIQELRALSKTLNKEWLEQFNLIENLQTEAARVNATDHLQVTIHHNNHSLPLQTDEQIILFRIVQEALQNAIKHAEAKHITISFMVDVHSLNILIEDDGNGFDVSQTPSGVGFINMNHRTQLLGGTIRWEASPQAGTRVSIHLPVKPI